MAKLLIDKRIWIATGVAFLVLLTFFDRNNFIERAKLRQQIRKLEAERDHFRERIIEDSTTIERLKHDSYLEKYARENYLMRRQDDEVFLIVKD